MSVGGINSTGPLFMASTPTITGPRPTAPTPTEAPQATSNPSAFQSSQAVGNSTLGATTAKDEVCKAVDNCDSPDGSVPELDAESTGMEGQELDGDFADATGEMPEVESAEGGSEGTQEVSEGGESGEAEGAEETSEADAPEESSESEGGGEVSESEGGGEVSESEGGGEVSESEGGGEVSESEGGGEVSEGSESDGAEASPGAEAQAGASGAASTAPQPAAQGGAGGEGGEAGGDKPVPVSGLVSKTALTVSRTMNAVGEFNKAPDARQGLVKPMPAPQGTAPASGNVTGAKLNTATAVGTARHLTNLADGNFTGSDVVAAGELANTAAGALHTKQGSQATAVLLQRAGGMAAGAGVAGFAVNLATRDFSATGQNMAALANDPGNAELQSQVAADVRGVTNGVQDVVNAARSAAPTLEAARGTLGSATTTAGRIAERAAGPAAHAAASASRAVGRLAPGVNVVIAAVDTAAAAADINKAMKNPTRDNVVNAGLSSIVAAGSIAAASNVPVVSQVGAAVSMAGDAAKLVYNNRAAIGRAASSAATTVTRAASSAASAVSNAASNAASSVRNAASNAASAATAAVSNRASQAYSWAKSWF
ncbi:MAG: hypothetical protein AB7I41_20065 [Candidatus Sericytochromatia bacterium]